MDKIHPFYFRMQYITMLTHTYIDIQFPLNIYHKASVQKTNFFRTQSRKEQWLISNE